VLHRQGHSRVGQVGDGIHVFGVEPAAGDGGAHVGLVLVVGKNDFDFPAQHLAAQLFDGNARGFQRPLAGGIGGDAGEVAQTPILIGLSASAASASEPRAPWPPIPERRS
jgi:hypothetical protein